VEDEDNRDLMEEVSEEELKEVVHSFQKDKIPGPDGWSMDFFVGLFDLVGKDLLKVIEESRKMGTYIFLSMLPSFPSSQRRMILKQWKTSDRSLYATVSIR
jgi:hypothetical protein